MARDFATLKRQGLISDSAMPERPEPNEAEEHDGGVLPEMLNKLVGSAIDLWARTKHAHWNVTGPNFKSVHGLFDDLAENAEDWADEMAERVRGLDGEACGTVEDAAEYSTLPNYDLGVAPSDEHLDAILDSVKAFASGVKSGIRLALNADDQVTANILIGIGEAADYQAYLLKSHLE